MNKQNVSWKLVPVQPTEEMLKAMDECSTEGYDERLYAGHAASVYMAAVDVSPIPLQPKEPEQEPVAWITQGGKGWLRWHKSYDDNKDSVPLYTTPPQRTWVGLMRGVRVDGDNVVISAKGGNDAARELCAYLIDEMS